MDDQSASHSAAFAEMYDAISASRDDAGFGRSSAAGSGGQELDEPNAPMALLMPISVSLAAIPEPGDWAP